MELVRHILERVVGSRKYAEPAAKVCITIIEVIICLYILLFFIEKLLIDEDSFGYQYVFLFTNYTRNKDNKKNI